MADDNELIDDELFDKVAKAIEAAAEGKGTLAEARAASLEIAEFRPRGMFNDGSEDTPERIYGAAANTFKMALDALEADQETLALQYVKVARIKLDKAREG
ncbi:MAG: hypothetical protein ACR2FO_02840 [Actinomycetota bacterium]